MNGNGTASVVLEGGPYAGRTFRLGEFEYTMWLRFRRSWLRSKSDAWYRRSERTVVIAGEEHRVLEHSTRARNDFRPYRLMPRQRPAQAR